MTFYCPKCRSYKEGSNELSTCRCGTLFVKMAMESVRTQSHYTQYKIQPVKFIGDNNLNYLQGNIIKYVCRYGKKNGLEDLEKARHYLDMLIALEKQGEVII